MKKLPKFFKDDSKSFKVEEVIDYFMAWTIRCADVKYKNQGLAHQYAKKILTKLIFDNVDNYEKRVYKNIQTWKQWANIDLWVELDVDDVNKYVIIIENKMYSSIREGQLFKYKQIAESFCKIEKSEHIIKYIFLRPDYELESKEKEFCIKSGYEYHNLEQLQEQLDQRKPSGNALFDEFWFNW